MPKLSVEELERRLDFSENKRSILLRKMAGKRIDEDTFGWSIADLMTLLLIFFILFYSNQLDQTASAVAVAESATEKSRSQTVFEWLIPNHSIPEVVEKDSRPQTPPAQGATTMASPALELLRAEIEQAAYGTGDAMQIREEDRRLVVVLGEQVTFDAGHALLLPGFQPILKRVSEAIASRPELEVIVSGHTDDRPISNDRFPSNWELSTARAAVAARFLIENGVPAKRITVQGFADTRSLTNNLSEEDRQRNRRVELALMEK